MSTTTSDTHITKKAPVMIRWTCEDDREIYLSRGRPEPSCQPLLDICHVVATKEASINLRIPIAIKAMPRKINIYYRISPEKVTSMELLEKDFPLPVLNSITSTMASTAQNVIGLSFLTKRAGDLIVPIGVPMEAKTRQSANVLQVVQSLARATSLQMYFPREAISNDEALKELCSLSGSDCLNDTVDDFSMLYGGKGGEILQNLDSLVQKQAENPHESPPSYDEIADLPSARGGGSSKSPRTAFFLPEQPPSKKQRVHYANEIEKPKAVQWSDEDIEWKKDVEKRMSALTEELAEMKKQHALATKENKVIPSASRFDGLEAGINGLREHVANCESRMKVKIEEEVSFATTGLHRKLEQTFEPRLDARINELIDQRMAGFHEEFDRRLDDLDENTGYEIELKMENMLGHYKEELGDEVNERLKDVEENLKDKIRHVFASVEID
ncbi:hypothetical protein K490DRAFT_65792 [Saccharata proteae CBS 121410]|uniref:Uncharacterized protein n=1 Tax=Saccharata proteae CBS 121410 TaxID=1314787 RepID=A0A9P4LXA0_9PEZI|nr:hypothetical protein K490DRAFT_65792 [Saccharata proteae CBS 121410]